MAISKFLAKSNLKISLSNHLKILLNDQVESSWWWPTCNSSQCSNWKFLSVTNQIFFSLINKIFVSVTKLKVLHSEDLQKIPLIYKLKVPPKSQGENVSQLPPQNSLQRSGWIFLLTKLNIPVSDQIENSSWWQAQNSSQWP